MDLDAFRKKKKTHVAFGLESWMLSAKQKKQMSHLGVIFVTVTVIMLLILHFIVRTRKYGDIGNWCYSLILQMLLRNKMRSHLLTFNQEHQADVIEAMLGLRVKFPDSHWSKLAENVDFCCTFIYQYVQNVDPSWKLTKQTHLAQLTDLIDSLDKWQFC